MRGSDAHYLLYCRAYAAATALRLTLPDAMQEDWLAPVLLNWAGVIMLAANGTWLGWLACGAGAGLPILLFEDQLTQSTYLVFCAAVALACHATKRKGDVIVSVRWLTAGVYALAALHKLNRDYFDPAFSCANEGMRVLVERSPGLLPAGFLPDRVTFDSPAWPLVHIVVEIGIVVLLLWRPRAGIALAALMHIPLTIIFAPGFAFTLMSGWVCFLTHGELDQLWRFARARWWVIVPLGGIPAALSRALLFPGRWSSDPDWCIKEVVLWLVAATLVLAVRWQPGKIRGWPPRAAGVIVGAFLANGLTPYFGAQFHHTGAMLSNLRVDEGCHNSLLFPASLASDPYVRVDALEVAPQRAAPETLVAITNRLWDVRALYQARQSWCRIHTEPLPARGSYRGRPFATDDICAEWPLPTPAMAGFRRFQVNLKRSCPTRCLH